MTETVALLQSAHMAAGKGTGTTTTTTTTTTTKKGGATTPRTASWAGAVLPHQRMPQRASAHHPSSPSSASSRAPTIGRTSTAVTTTAPTVNGGSSGTAPPPPPPPAASVRPGKTRLPVAFSSSSSTTTTSTGATTPNANCPSLTLHLHRPAAPSRPRSPASVIAAVKQRRQASSLASPPSSSLLPPSAASAPASATASTPAASPEDAVVAAVSPNPPVLNNASAHSTVTSSPVSSVGPDTQPTATAHRDHDHHLASRYSAHSTASSLDSSFSFVRRRPRSFSDRGPRPTSIFNHSAPTPRRASNPEPLAGDILFSSLPSTHSSPSTRHYPRREPAFFSARGASTSTRPPPSLHGRQSFASQGRRELLLLKTVSQNSPPNENRRASVQATYKPPLNSPLTTNSTPARVAPIRSFRSSGSRRSLLLDMNFTPQPYDLGDNAGVPLDDDDTLRDLDTRYQRHVRDMAPPVSGRHGPSNAEDTGDMFLKIARDEALNRASNRQTPDGAYSPVSGTFRPSHRRPMSTNVASYQPLSPPKLRRRLSDQRDRQPATGYEEDQDTQSQVSRFSNYRSLGRDKAASAHPAEDASRFRPNSTLRASPLSSRSPVHQDAASSLHSRRRSSVTETGQQAPARTPTYKSATFQGHAKAYSSSPLVRSFDLRQQYGQDGQPNGMEGTESTASTTAPSTVWDELDDLKSRIHRLELTGKLPSTSGAAVARMAENRPATATTTVTTASLSPKRHNQVQADESSTATSTQKELQPLLQQALAKSKHLLGQDVFQALECAANDAVALSSMMGGPGQPGPISSGASVVGSTNTITDRQLRRKADSVCRSLTELCIALNEEAGGTGTSVHPAQGYANETVRGTPTTPTIPKSYSGLGHSRRSSVVGEGNLPMSQSSPRIMSKFEERRNSLLHGSGPPVSLLTHSNHPAQNDSNVSRRSSLLVSRTRQTASDEPQDGRESSLLRSRRARTEELEDSGRKSSYLTRSRRGTVDEGSDQQPLSRSPTRANPQYNAGETLDMQDVAQDTGSTVSSASRRRFVSDLHSSRLAAPTGSSPAPPRKYLERSVSTRESAPPTSSHISRNFSMHGRSGSLSTRRANRESMIPAAPSTPVHDYGTAQ